MPIYEHKCKRCGHTFDVMVSMSERSRDVPCPECKAPETKRLISATSFSLKGGGWYKDGYSKK